MPTVTMFDYEFMRTAFVAGGLVAVVAGAVGYFLVLRNLTFAGHALSHVGFAGATGAVLIGVSALWGLLAFTVAAAVVMGLLGERLRGRDVAVGIILALALGMGVLFLSLYTTHATQATAILFGNVLGVEPQTLWALWALTGVSLAALGFISRPLLFATLAPELADAKGVSLRLVSVLFLAIVAIAVAEAAQIVGVDLIARVPEDELPALTKEIETRIGRAGNADRARRIALVGLRGAGKSTLGRMLAQHMNAPFVELDRIVEQDYGASIPDLIEMAGTATFRRYERSALERIVGSNKAAIITTAGGIVSNPETYALLLRRTHTVWIKAQPEDHMARVMAQGDFRPMAKNRETKANEAMTDLVAILEARRADYARAEAELDTSGDTIERSFAKLLRIVTPWLGRESGS